MFTRLENGWQSLLWDGDYDLYAKLRYEPLFIGVLHNPDGKKEVLKIWDESKNSWSDREPGTYIARDPKGFFHAVEKEFVDSNRRKGT